MSCGIGRRCNLAPVLLWLWHGPVASALILPLAWEPPYTVGAALKKKKTKKKRGIYVSRKRNFIHNKSYSLSIQCVPATEKSMGRRWWDIRKTLGNAQEGGVQTEEKRQRQSYYAEWQMFQRECIQREGERSLLECKQQESETSFSLQICLQCMLPSKYLSSRTKRSRPILRTMRSLGECRRRYFGRIAWN